MRKIIYQNYNWMFKENYEEQDLAINNFNGFEIVNIPHTNKQLPLNNFDETLSHIVSTYKKVINIKLENKKYFLVFEGVGHYSKLYVNGVFVKEHKCHIGFAFDGDCDRCIAVDGRGRVVDGDAIMYILAKRLKDKGALSENTVVATVMSNSGLDTALSNIGISCERTDVGDRFVYERMQSGDYSLGGEQSGHIIMKK